VANALREHATATRDRVTVAWVLIDGVNCDDAEVDALVELMDGCPIRVNLIEVNDSRPDGFRPPPLQRLNAVRRRLCDLGIPVVRRYSGGVSAHAACGMLASRRIDGMR
jgi:23S rRNA (adenine2503-C2)-methyltransferase